jgi:hypothetical protein
MHSLLKHKMLQLTLKISLYVASTCFGPFGPSSGSIRWNLVKVTIFVEIISKNTSLKLCCAVAICASVCSASHSNQYTHYRLKHILPLHSNNFNDVFLLIISTEAVALATFHRMLPDDGSNGPKHIAAIQIDILTVSCSILSFNKKCIFGKKSFKLCKIWFELQSIQELYWLDMN